MDFNDLISLFFDTLDRLNFYWNFYVVGIVAILTWLFSLEKDLSWQIKLLLSLGFLFFMGMNISGLLWSFAFLEGVRLELQAKLNPGTFETQQIYNIINRRPSHIYPWIVWGSHIVLDTGMLIAIWNNKIWRRLRPNRSSKV